LYLIINLGQSPGFTPTISTDIVYPVTMFVDYIRVYQPKGQQNVGCDPKDFPTAKYINQYGFFYRFLSDANSAFRYIEAYTNPNLTQWGMSSNRDMYGYNQTMPRNSFLGQC
jgi:beta-glucan synthesis-associated protein KRE6